MKDWDNLVLKSKMPAHYMQSAVWGVTKSSSSWPATQMVVKTKSDDQPLQVFSRTVPGLGRVHYAPEVVGVTKENLPEITKHLRNQYTRGLAFKLELYQPRSEELIKAFHANGWRTGNSVQPRHTVIADLTGSEDAMFNRIKKRARYEIRFAQRSGVKVNKVAVTEKNLDVLANLITVTGQRSGAFFRKRSYSDKYWHAFAKAGQGSLYFAQHESDILAATYVITYGTAAWYKDSGSSREKSKLMGSRYLLWEIMRDLQTQGIKQYDLSGIPNENELETSSLKGLYTFKTGFSNETTTLMPAMELPLGRRYSLWPKAEGQYLRAYSKATKDFWY